MSDGGAAVSAAVLRARAVGRLIRRWWASAGGVRRPVLQAQHAGDGCDGVGGRCWIAAKANLGCGIAPVIITAESGSPMRAGCVCAQAKPDHGAASDAGETRVGSAEVGGRGADERDGGSEER